MNSFRPSAAVRVEFNGTENSKIHLDARRILSVPKGKPVHLKSNAKQFVIDLKSILNDMIRENLS